MRANGKKAVQEGKAVSPEQPPPASGEEPTARRRLMLLAVLGVVYGDIGTSPIYALRQCFAGAAPIPVSPINVLGALSLIFWSLIVVISLKYMIFVLRADNHGEGGIFALLALLHPSRGQERLSRRALILLGVLGAALLYGGVMITPAISVLSAVEGLEVAAPALDEFILPITVGILVGLFLFQRRGTARVGVVFGPIMVVWFTVLALLGGAAILREPSVLAALNPGHAEVFFAHNGWAGVLILYAVFLVVTGGEALYADLGHFGRFPIRFAWFALVLPALLLNYFGQGALLLRDPTRNAQPFYHLAPQWGLYPLVFLATVATVIASQAVITGAFSLTRQAVQLGLYPRIRVLQTSAETMGQIYVPTVNWMLMVAAIGLVIGFRTSSNLAAAYGVAVNMTMAITTVLAFNVAREHGGWGLATAGLFLAGFLAVDLTYLGSNLMRIPDGGWFPLLMAVLFFTVMSTWARGSEIVENLLERNSRKLETLLGEIGNNGPVRVPGTAVFLTGNLEESPAALEHHLRHSKALHERVILLTVITERVPKVTAQERVEVKQLEYGFYRIILHYGFMQVPNIPSELVGCKDKGIDIDLEQVTYYVGRRTLIPAGKKAGMFRWREALYAFLARNSVEYTTYYQIPSDRVMEVGLQLRI
jgi:KUP system potassium uptake protein